MEPLNKGELANLYFLFRNEEPPAFLSAMALQEDYHVHDMKRREEKKLGEIINDHGGGAKIAIKLRVPQA